MIVLKEIIEALKGELRLAGEWTIIRQILIALGIFIIFLVISKVFTKYIFKILSRITSKTKSVIDDEVLDVFKKPTKTFFIVLGIYLALLYISNSEIFNIFITKAFRSSIIILIAQGFYNLEGTYSILHDKMNNKFNFRTNKILKPFITKVLRFITIVIAVAMVAIEFGFDVNGFLAGLGLGGLAFALAAQETLADVFGGIVIITDRPFDIGDWISTSDVEGTVEDINFRSTKIRTFSKALVTVPNSKLADQPIVNNSRRGIRRVSFKLGLRYDTPVEKMKISIDKIDKMLREHPKVDKETIFVKFQDFNDSSLDIFIYFFTVTAVWSEYLEIQEDVNFKILEILEKEEVGIAFPSRSLYFNNKIDVEKIESSDK